MRNEPRESRQDDWHIEQWEVLDSTQERVELLLREAPRDRCVVVAATQRAGRGRRGAPWSSPLGGLWCSFSLWRAGHPDPFLGLLVAGAIRDALVPALAGGERLAIQWPNDLVVGGRKCGGVLLKTVTGSTPGPVTPGHWVACGAGIDLDLPADELAAIDPPATSLAREFGRCPSPLAALSLILPAIDRWLADDARAGRAHTIERLTPCIATLRRRIRWQSSLPEAPMKASLPEGRVLATPEGEAIGIELDGALRVRTDDGREILLRSEQVHHVTEPR